MRNRITWLLIAGLLATGPAIAAAAPQAIDAQAIRDASGADAKKASDGVVRISWSRSDVPVMVDGRRLPPAVGLGSWAAFAPTAKGALVMGDTVVFEDEVDTAMDSAFAHGLDVTGLHNHFFHDTPKVYFMHLGGEGAPADLARGVRAVWDAIKAVRKARPVPATTFGAPTPVSGALDVAAIGKAVGQPAPVSDGVAKSPSAARGECTACRSVLRWA